VKILNIAASWSKDSVTLPLGVVVSRNPMIAENGGRGRSFRVRQLGWLWTLSIQILFLIVFIDVAIPFAEPQLVAVRREEFA
jgi:hypothetical protein